VAIRRIAGSICIFSGAAVDSDGLDTALANAIRRDVARERRLAESGAMRDLADLKQRLRVFVAERDWDQFHSPKNLAMALSVEASELVELFQWLTEAESAAPDAERRRRAADELADVLVYLVRIADRLDIDLLQAADEKLRSNAVKYPAERVRGQARKYDEY
jgi:NTP pyrophosphatase (non-canonical NTP hydrolase)